MSSRELPFNVEAEQAVLGGLMLAPDSLAKVGDWLDEGAFFRRDHQMIYRAIREMADKSAVDAVTLSEWFDANALGDLIGGAAYLIELANMTPSAANIVAYAEIVAEKARLRSAVELGERLAGAALAVGADSRMVMSEAAHELAHLQADKQRGGLEAIRPVLKEWFQDLSARFDGGGAPSGLLTPWDDLNDAIGSMQPGSAIVLAGRPNMGKSIIGGQIGTHAATALKRRTGIFSLEMTRNQFIGRSVACIGRIDYRWLQRPDSSNEEAWPRLTNAMAILNEAPLMIDETPSLSIEQVMARARRAHMQAPLDLIVVDHLHEMQIDADNENSEHARNVRQLKALGKEFGCPVLILAQLNRKVEDRPDKRPRMSDLRGSGGIEEAADLILFIYRDEYYNPESPDRGIVEISVAKGRDVQTGRVIKLLNRYDQMRAENYDPLLHEPYVPAETKPQKSGWGRRRSNDD